MKSVFVLIGLVATAANVLALEGCCSGGMCNGIPEPASHYCTSGTCDGFDGRACTVDLDNGGGQCPNTDGSCGSDGCPIVC